MLEQLFEIGEQPYTAADAEWDAFVMAHPHGSLLQTTNWARLKGRFGWRGHRVWLKQEGQLVAGAQILFRSAAFGLVKVGYIPHGPLVDWANTEQVDVLFNQIDFAIYEHRAGLVKFEPLIWQNDGDAATFQTAVTRLDGLQETDTIQPPRTMLLDLRPDLPDIMAAMKQKTRYNIRLAERKEVVVRQGNAEDLLAFNQLMQLTGQRQEFGVHAPEYYQFAYELFAPEHAALFLAEYDKRPLAAIMVFAWGDTAAYFYGASSNEERERMPTYAVQWAAIQWAKAHGCLWYDLWGVPDATEAELEAQFQERNDGLWGVYRFKRGFSGQVSRTVGAVDRVYNKLVYRLYQARRGG